MATTDERVERDERGSERYTPDQDRSLSEAVLDAIEASGDVDLSTTDFVLYDAINPDALDHLFRYSGEADTELTFDVGDDRVTLRGNSEVRIEVTDRQDD